MKLDTLNRWLTLLANLGVIAGIVFVALELQQNNELLEAQARSARLNVQTDFLNVMHQSDVAELVTKARANETLTREDQHRLFWLATRLITAWQYVYNESVAGFIPQEAIPVEIWSATFHDRLPGVKEMWEQQKSGMDPDFVSWMEENIVNKD